MSQTNCSAGESDSLTEEEEEEVSYGSDAYLDFEGNSTDDEAGHAETSGPGRGQGNIGLKVSTRKTNRNMCTDMALTC